MRRRSRRRTPSPRLTSRLRECWLGRRKAGPKAERTEELARRAVAELTRAEKEGYFRDPNHRVLLESLHDLKPLHARADYGEFLARVLKQ